MSASGGDRAVPHRRDQSAARGAMRRIADARRLARTADDDWLERFALPPRAAARFTACGSCSRSSARRRNASDRGSRQSPPRIGSRRRCSNCRALVPCWRSPFARRSATSGASRRPDSWPAMPVSCPASTPAPAGIAQGGSRGAARRGCAGPWSKRRCTAHDARIALDDGAAAWRCGKACSQPASRSRACLRRNPSAVERDPLMASPGRCRRGCNMTPCGRSVNHARPGPNRC